MKRIYILGLVMLLVGCATSKAPEMLPPEGFYTTYSNSNFQASLNHYLSEISDKYNLYNNEFIFNYKHTYGAFPFYQKAELGRTFSRLCIDRDGSVKSDFESDRDPVYTYRNSLICEINGESYPMSVKAMSRKLLVQTKLSKSNASLYSLNKALNAVEGVFNIKPVAGYAGTANTFSLKLSNDNLFDKLGAYCKSLKGSSSISQSKKFSDIQALTCTDMVFDGSDTVIFSVLVQNDQSEISIGICRTGVAAIKAEGASTLDFSKLMLNLNAYLRSNKNC